jgi:hypothetical protein
VRENVDQHRYQRDELARLIRRHGGILGAMEFGVFARDIDDPELANAWRQLEDGYSKIRPALLLVGQVLLKPRQDAAA